jgi:hypothetical protein
MPPIAGFTSEVPFVEAFLDPEHHAPRSPALFGPLVGLGDPVEGKALLDREAGPSGADGRVDVSGSGPLDFVGKIVATQKVDTDVLENEQPERDPGRGLCGRVGRDGSAVTEHLSIERDIRGKRHLDHMVDSVRSHRENLPDSVCRSLRARVDDVMCTRSFRYGSIVVGSHGCDHARAGVGANPIPHCPTAPAPPCIRNVRPSGGPATCTARCAVIPGSPRQAPCSKETDSGRSTA